MSQSPIQLNSVNKKGLVDALPLKHPEQLFSIHYPEKKKCRGTYEGEAHHRNLLVSTKHHFVMFRGARFDLKKIHIHSGSEHIVESDDPHDLEIHLIHAPHGSSVESPLVVIGILFRIGDSVSSKKSNSPPFGELLELIRNGSHPLNPSKFFPHGKNGHPVKTEWFHYEGSLTSFPYTENVSWFVIRSHGIVTPQQVAELAKEAEQAPRELQPLDRRLVVRSF